MVFDQGGGWRRKSPCLLPWLGHRALACDVEAALLEASEIVLVGFGAQFRRLSPRLRCCGSLPLFAKLWCTLGIEDVLGRRMVLVDSLL